MKENCLQVKETEAQDKKIGEKSLVLGKSYKAHTSYVSQVLITSKQDFVISAGRWAFSLYGG